MDKTLALKNAIEFAKQNPDSPQAVQLRRRIEAGMYNTELAQISKPVEQKPSVLKTVGNALISSEKGLGEDIAGGLSTILPKSFTGQDNLEAAQKVKEQTLATLINKLHEVQKNGGDTSKWLKLIGQTTGQEVPTMADLYPAIKKSNLQVLGDVGGTLLDIISVGSYGAAAKGAQSGKLLAKAGGVVEKTAAKIGIETVPKIIAPKLGKQALKPTLKTIAKTTAKQTALGGATGYGYDVAENLKEGQTGAEAFKPGFGATLGAGIPFALGVLKGGIALSKDIAPKFINSLIKPKQADFAYGKDPGRTVSSMGITGNNLDDFADNIHTAKREVGEQIGAIYSDPKNAGVIVDASDEIQKIDDAIAKASRGGKENQGIVTTLQNTKDALLFDHAVNADGVIEKIGTTPRDLSKLTAQEAFDLKKVIAEQTKFTGKASDDKTVNSILKSMYGGIKDKLNKGLGKKSPELIDLNQKFADLTSAEIATRNRDAIIKRADLVSLPIKVGSATALITALSTGGAAVPAILAGASAAVLDKALESTAVRTRIAAWLGSETPSTISKVLANNPEIKTVLLRALPKFASQIGGETP